MKNETEVMVLAVATREDGTNVVLLGITPDGVDALARGLTLTGTVPAGMRDVTDVIVLAARDGVEVRRRLQETGAPIYDHRTTH